MDESKKSILSIKSFTCEVCKRSFKFNSHLNVHKRSHSGEKPYECNICDKSFCRKGVLKQHMLSHSGKKNKFTKF